MTAPQPLNNPPKEFVITAIIDNGGDWHSTGPKIGDGRMTGPDYTDRDTARSVAP